MKKYISLLAAATLALGFTACEDVPAPYGIDTEKPVIPDTPTQGVIIDAPFSSGLGGFTAVNTVGNYPWAIDGSYGYVKVTSYVNESNEAAESWLVSPKFSLAEVTAAHVTFDYVLRYANASELSTNYKLRFSTNYDGDPAAATWIDADFTAEQSSGWQDWKAVDVNVPAELIGQENLTVALFYKADAKAATWELKNFKLEEGEAAGGEEPETPGEQTDVVSNGGFETWTNGVPDDWQSTTSASSATLTQSSDRHSGSYAVLVEGNADQNKRLASKEYNLKAGTYTLKFYAKGAGQVRPGYAVVTNGSIGGGDDYKYGGYAQTTADAWTEVTYEFTLSEATTVNFVIMNPKTSSYATASDKLIDDFSVVTSNGGIVGGDTPSPETPSTGGYLSETFAASQGAFTIDNKSLPEGSTYVWTHDANYSCMKASSFVGGSAKAAESWLISPVIDLSSASTATLTFDQAGKFFESLDGFKAACTLKVRTEGGEWTTLAYTGGEITNSDYTFATATASLNAYAGQKIQIAFAYTSSADYAGTWEIQNFAVK